MVKIEVYLVFESIVGSDFSSPHRKKRPVFGSVFGPVSARTKACVDLDVLLQCGGVFSCITDPGCIVLSSSTAPQGIATPNRKKQPGEPRDDTASWQYTNPRYPWTNNDHTAAVRITKTGQPVERGQCAVSHSWHASRVIRRNAYSQSS